MLATVKNYKGNQTYKFHFEDTHTFSESLPQTPLDECGRTERPEKVTDKGDLSIKLGE